MIIADEGHQREYGVTEAEHIPCMSSIKSEVFAGTISTLLIHVFS